MVIATVDDTPYTGNGNKTV